MRKGKINFEKKSYECGLRTIGERKKGGCFGQKKKEDRGTVNSRRGSTKRGAKNPIHRVLRRVSTKTQEAGEKIKKGKFKRSPVKGAPVEKGEGELGTRCFGTGKKWGEGTHARCTIFHDTSDLAARNRTDKRERGTNLTKGPAPLHRAEFHIAKEDDHVLWNRINGVAEKGQAGGFIERKSNLAKKSGEELRTVTPKGERGK